MIIKGLSKAFTLIELIIVIIIIGILATLGVSQMFGPREQAIKEEAKANLKLIAAAEKIYRLETATYCNATNTIEVNQRLRLSLPISNPNWNYKVPPVDVDANNFTAKAGRAPDNSTVWCINQSTEEPYQTSCSWE